MLNPTTGFYHEGPQIPLTENFCYALTLMEKKTKESVLEGLEYLEKLFPFQTPSGSFPSFLHHFPREGGKLTNYWIYWVLKRIRTRFYPLCPQEFRHKFDHVWESLEMCIRQHDAQGPWHIYRQILLAEKTPCTTPLPPFPSDPKKALFHMFLCEQEHLTPYCQDLELVAYPITRSQEGYFPKKTLLDLFFQSESQNPLFCLGTRPTLSTMTSSSPLVFSEPYERITPNSHLFMDPIPHHPYTQTTQTLDCKGSDLQYAIHVQPHLPTDKKQLTTVFRIYCSRQSHPKVWVGGRQVTSFSCDKTPIEIRTDHETFHFEICTKNHMIDAMGHVSLQNRPTQTLEGVYDLCLTLRVFRVCQEDTLYVRCKAVPSTPAVS